MKKQLRFFMNHSDEKVFIDHFNGLCDSVHEIDEFQLHFQLKP